MADSLVIIDLQKGLHSPTKKLYQLDKVLEGVNERIAEYRQQAKPILFIQHTDEELPLNSEAWSLMEELDHQPTDYYLLKTHADSFFQTNLQATLTELGVESIEFCGAQTEYCVDTTIRFAHGLGYHCWMKSGLHTTVDSQLLTASTIIAHHEAIWQNRFLKLL